MKFNATIKIALLAFMICFSTVLHIRAQNNGPTEPILANGGNNEDSKAVLDLVAQKAGAEKLIILVVHLGDREVSRKLNRGRLEIAGTCLQNTRGIPKAHLIRAEGDRTRGRGRLEIYLDGKFARRVYISAQPEFCARRINLFLGCNPTHRWTRAEPAGLSSATCPARSCRPPRRLTRWAASLTQVGV